MNTHAILRMVWLIFFYIVLTRIGPRKTIKKNNKLGGGDTALYSLYHTASDFRLNVSDFKFGTIDI